MTGVLLVDKPTGITSADVVRRLKRRLGRRTKIGHVGTLDPFASGLLPLCVGEATKVARYLAGDVKVYEGTIELGRETDTLDPTGTVTATAPVPPIEEAQLAAVARRLTGTILQKPPMYSALKRDGVPLYRLARRGEHVERAARAVEIAWLQLRPVGPDRIEMATRCSKGTYVRVLAADVGRALGTVAHLGRLRRLAVGPLGVERAWSLEALETWPDGTPLPVLPIPEALDGLRREDVSAEELEQLRRGRQEPLGRLAPAAPGTTALLLSGDGGAVACGVAETDADGRWRLVRLLNPEAPSLHA